MVREFPRSELIDKQDLKNQLREIIKNDLFNIPFTLQDIADGLGSEAFNPNERGKPRSFVDSDPQVSIKNTLNNMVKEGYLIYSEEDETYEVSDDARMSMSA